MTSRAGSSRYGALSDMEDDFEEGSPLTRGSDGAASPVWDNQRPASPGHLVSSGRGVTQRSGSGTLASAFQSPPSRQGNSGDGAFSALKGWASFIREKTSQASTSVAQRDWSQEQQTIGKVRDWSADTAGRLQTTATRGWQQAREVTVEGIRKLTGGALAAVCKQEAAAQPCPRAVLVCCSALVSGGLATEGLFRRSSPADTASVHWLLGALHTSSGVVLPAAGASPHVVAAALMQWLLTLDDPLLTYKLLPDFLVAGRESPLRAVSIMAELPPANNNCLQVLLETWHRLANSPDGNMDAHAVAENVVPFLAWHPPPPQSKQQSYMTLQEEGSPRGHHVLQAEDGLETASNASDEAFGAPGTRTDLSPAETKAMVLVVECLI